MVLPELRALVEATGESAAYHVRQGATRLCLYRVDSPHPIRDHIKAATPYTRLALGVAAWMRYVTGVDEKGQPIEVKDPSALFPAERPVGQAGSVVTSTLNGTRPLLVVVQALVAPAAGNRGIPI